MTDDQFEKFMVMMQQQMQVQNEALQAQAAALNKIAAALSATEGSNNAVHSDLSSEIKFLRRAETLKAALDLNMTRTTSNTALQEDGGLSGSIKDISTFIHSSETPESWNENTTNEIYVKTFSSKPLKFDED